MAQAPESSKRPQFYALASIAIILGLLYFGQEVLVPLALALLLSFLLTPLVTRLERLHFGRVVSTLLVVLVALSVVIALGWTVERRIVQIVDRLPEYRESIQAKFARLTRSGGVVEKVREEIKQTMAAEATTQPAPETQPGAASIPFSADQMRRAWAAAPPVATPALPKPTPDDPWPVRVYPKPASTLEVAGTYLGRFLGPFGTAGLVLVFVVFMLIGREDLRDRLIRLVGDRRLHVTTQALDDAAKRISRFLLAQLMINTVFGATVALGLWAIDLTLGGGQSGFMTAVVAGLLCGVLRFVPYIGTWIGAALPLGLAFAAHSGNGVFFATLAMFLIVELIVSQVVEPNLLGSSTGLSPIAVLVTAVFWTWLWGPVGLLLSMPLTVILVVMGKYVPQLEFLDVLLGDTPVLDPPTRVYQRLIAGDDEEATDLAQEYLKDRSLDAVYDDLLIPALAQAESDRHRGRLDAARHATVREGIREMVETLGDEQRSSDSAAATEQTVKDARGQGGPDSPAPGTGPWRPLPQGAVVNVLCLPARGEADDLASLMLAQSLERRGYQVTRPHSNTLAAEMVGIVGESNADVVVVSAMPPKAALHARYLLKRISARHPGARVIVGLWNDHRESSAAALGDRETTRIARRLADAQEQLEQLTPVAPAQQTKAGPALSQQMPVVVG